MHSCPVWSRVLVLCIDSCCGQAVLWLVLAVSKAPLLSEGAPESWTPKLLCGVLPAGAAWCRQAPPDQWVEDLSDPVRLFDSQKLWRY